MLASRRLTAGLQCKITDFGLSSQLSQSHSLVKTRVGTPYYMAPEVFRLKPYGAPADVWSFGVVAFELLALERPFRAGSLVELEARVLGGMFDASAALAGCGHPTTLTELAGALLQPEPGERMALETMLSRLEAIPEAVLSVAPPAAAPTAAAEAAPTQTDDPEPAAALTAAAPAAAPSAGAAAGTGASRGSVGAAGAA